ncbi:ATP-binding protein [Deinococcus cavernae]|uniref:ATP-binding protein n=2 Tax=Deinococcus cavernae TaxID=2320857 RepID=A0A418VBU4_9DEIO|nr:ATP-binding protein [Deinococcus cavernae]
MCGPAGSGKTSYALRLEKAGMVRLSFDVEAWRRGITRMPLAPDVHRSIELDLQKRLLELVEAGRDVVLDFSFWSKKMRDTYRQLLAPLGVVPETISFATDRETILRRLQQRQGGHPDDFALPVELAMQYFDGFEVPTADEGPLTVVR